MAVQTPSGYQKKSASGSVSASIFFIMPIHGRVAPGIVFFDSDSDPDPDTDSNSDTDPDTEKISW